MAKVLDFTEEFNQDVKIELAMKAQADKIQKNTNTYTEEQYLSMIRRWRNGDLKDTVTLINCYNKQKGAIITYSSKSDLKSSKGTRQTDLMEIVKQQPTHWSGNSYLTGKLKHQHGVLGGNTKNNLLQINVFVVDVDTKKTSWRVLLKNSKKIGLDPLCVIETDHGYQLIYSIKGGLHLNGGARLQSALESATRCFNNLRWKLQGVGVPVDQCCHPFGICRFPQRNRVLYINTTNLMDYDQWREWSYKNDYETQLKNNRSFSLISGHLHGWARAAVNFNKFKEGDRNTILYTVALEYKVTGLNKSIAETDLLSWALEMGLDRSEIKATIKSAYQSEYKPAPKYWRPILNKYNIEPQKDAPFKPFEKMSDRQRKAFWAARKPKKPREQRHSHFSEWEQDILNWIKGNPGRKTNYRELSAELNAPLSSFKTALKNLVESRQIALETKKGRYGYIILSIVSNSVEEPKKQVKAVNELPQWIENENDLMILLKPKNRERGST